MRNLGIRMLRNLGIRGKILAVLALPVVVLVLAASIIAVGAVNEARDARVLQQVASTAPGLSQLVRGIQAERSLTLAVLAGDESVRPQLEEVRAAVDKGIAQVEGAGIDYDRLEKGAVEAIAASNVAEAQLPTIRQQVDGGVLSSANVAQAYSDVIAADIAIPNGIADSTSDRELAANLRAYAATEQLIESIIQEIDLGTGPVATGVYPEPVAEQMHDILAEQDIRREVAVAQAEKVGVRVPPTTYTLALARQRTLEDADGVIEGITVDQWRAAGDADVQALATPQGAIADLGIERSAKLANDASRRAFQVGVAAALLVLIPVLLALFIARGITRPLRRLTEAAAQIRAELPAMVERMQTPGEGPGMTLPEIPVTSQDEVGRLAAAFNDVNSTTVQVAQEQAALRGSIAAMFVNVARRDQVLLSRQLAFIDQLERSEENPATLENLFKLDHLATRMRRNAESLLVLAGIDTGRRLRRPMPLSDVIRTASSEIENYERIDLALRVDPPMVGHMALSTAHLLAELLENATRFSDPGSRVVVSTGSNAKGVVVTISDDGLGMSPDEIAQGNAQVTDSAASEVVGAQRLGFFVVGRLARKLDAKVSLKAGRSSGTVVTIELGPALFVAGTVVEVPVDGDSVPVEDAGTTKISLPDTADAALTAKAAEEAAAQAAAAVTDATQATPTTDATPATDQVPATEARQDPAADRTDSGLPRRGGALPSRSRQATPPVAPVAPAPAAASPAVPAQPVAAGDAAPVAGPTATPDALPRRSGAAAARAATPAPVAPSPVSPTPVAPSTPPVVPTGTTEVSVPAPAPEAEPAAPARTGGLFSGFRARRPEAADSSPEPAPAPLELPEPSDVAEVAPAAAPAVPRQPVREESATPSSPFAALTTEPVTDAVAAMEAVDPAAVEAAPAESGLTTRRFAASELTALSVPEPTLAPAKAAAAAPAPSPVLATQPEEAPFVPAHGAPAMTILPGASRNRSFRRGRRAQPEAAVEAVQPMTRREMRRLEQGEGTSAPWSGSAAPAAADAPVAPYAPATAAPASPVTASAPAWAPPAAPAPGTVSPAPASSASAAPAPALPTPAAPVPAPPSLFGTPAPAPSGYGPAAGAGDHSEALPARPPVPSQGGSPEATGPVLPPPSLFGTPSVAHAPGIAPPAAAPAAGAPGPAPVADVPTVPAVPSFADGLRQRSALASEALTELSQLASYSPAAVETKPASTLIRRTPAATPAAEISVPRPAPTPVRRSRNASDVRSMLSGFQAGVARGRTSPGGAADQPGTPAD